MNYSKSSVILGENMDSRKLKNWIKKIFINRIMFSIAGIAFIVLFSLMLLDVFTESREITSENEKNSLLNQLYYVSESINYYFYDMKNDLELLSYNIYQDEENTTENMALD